MYKISDLVIYGSHGVCRVEAIDTPDILGIDKNRLYYTLYSLYLREKIYTPIDTVVFMRPVLTHTEARHLISLIPTIREDIYNNCDMKSQEGYYKESIQTHNCSDLIKLIKTICKKEILAVEQGKKLGQIDIRFMRKAEDLLYGELAVALNIPKDSVKSYIKENVKEIENMYA